MRLIPSQHVEEPTDTGLADWLSQAVDLKPDHLLVWADWTPEDTSFTHSG